MINRTKNAGVSSVLSDQPITKSVLYQFAGIFGIGFFNHFFPVRIYRVHTNAQLVGNVFAAVAGGY